MVDGLNVSGLGLMKRRSMPPYMSYGSGRTLLFLCYMCMSQSSPATPSSTSDNSVPSTQPNNSSLANRKRKVVTKLVFVVQ